MECAEPGEKLTLRVAVCRLVGDPQRLMQETAAALDSRPHPPVCLDRDTRYGSAQRRSDPSPARVTIGPGPRRAIMNVGPVLYVLIIILVVLAIIYLFQRTRR